jgi:hypothetical protein
MLRNIIVLVSLLALSITAANAQFLSNQKGKVMLKGQVVDKFTGEPMQVTIDLRDAQGNKIIKFKSNSKDGTFQQLLEAGKEYKMIFMNYDILRETRTIKIKDSENYDEEEFTFEIPRLEKGVEICGYDAFSGSSAQLSNEAKQRLDELKKQMRFNRSVKFDLFISAKSKSLETKRINAVNQYIDDWGYYKRRVNIISGNETKDFVVKVNEIKNVFD